MGEEYGEARPFPFFCSFADPGLIEAVRRGRCAELTSVRFRWQNEPPNAQTPTTFDSAKLSWSWVGDRHRTGLRALYQDLLWGRLAWPAMTERCVNSAEIVHSREGEPFLWLQLGAGGSLRVCANLSQAPIECPGRQMADAVVLLSTSAGIYGGDGAAVGQITQLQPFECVVWGPATWPKPTLRRRNV